MVKNCSEDYLINFTEFTERFGIQSTDIPLDSSDYYLKEVYYFDTPTSSLRNTFSPAPSYRDSTTSKAPPDTLFLDSIQ